MSQLLFKAMIAAGLSVVTGVANVKADWGGDMERIMARLVLFTRLYCDVV